MKKVWILQRWETMEEMTETYNDIKDMAANCSDEKLEPEWKRLLECHQKTIEDNPNGRWRDIIGRSVYSQFIYVAREQMLLPSNKDKQWRVVEGKIEVDAKYWVGYKFTKENDGILRYLYATV